MAERLLNGLLGVQVLASVVLTGVLLYRPPLVFPPPEPPRLEAPQHPQPPAMATDLFRPLAVWVHPGGGRYMALAGMDPLFPLTWKQMRQSLVRAIGRAGPGEAVTALELAQAAAQPLVGADLPAALPAFAWARLWEAEDTGMPPGREILPEGRAGPVDRVVFTLSPPGGIYLIGARATVRLPLPGPEREELAQRVQGLDPQAYPALRLLTAAAPADPPRVGDQPGGGERDEYSPWLLVPDGPTSAASPLVLPQLPDPASLLARFFPDVSVVRQIREQEGSLVYTDGRRGLRLFSHGALEYIESRGGSEGVPPELPNALQLAQEFMAVRGLWPAGATLTGFSRSGAEARLTFAIRGPLLPRMSVRPLLDLRLAGDRVVYLYRAPDFTTVAAAGNDRLEAPEAALQQIRAARGGRRLRVRSVLLAHRVNASGLQVLTPVWWVGLQGGEVYMVDARNGQVLW